MSKQKKKKRMRRQAYKVPNPVSSASSASKDGGGQWIQGAFSRSVQASKEGSQQTSGSRGKARSSGALYRTSVVPEIEVESSNASKIASKTIAFLLLAFIILCLCAVLPSMCHTPSLPQSESASDSDISDSDFKEDESFSVDKIEGNVLGTGFALADLQLYAAPDEGSVAVCSVLLDEMLLIYGAEDGYYYVCTLENPMFGYVRSDLIDTGGIDLLNPDAPTQIVDELSGEITYSDMEEPAESSDSTSESTTAKKTTTTKKTTKTTKSSKPESGSASSSSAKTTTATTALSPENFPTNSSPYFILVEKGSHTITIYAKDEDGKYTRELRTYLTATGRTSSLTPTGLFKVGAKEKWHTWGTNSYSPYCTRYYGGLFFHGPIYKAKNFGTLKENSVSAIGTNASSGCMRTSCQAAYFIYRFCPTGTYVKIVSGSPLGHRASKPSIASQYVDPATGEVPVAGVSISPASVSLKIGDTKALSANITPDSASETACRWLSSNKSVATVSSKGVVTAKGAGTCTITVTTVDGEYTSTCTITVTDPNAATTSKSTTTAKTTVSTESTEKTSGSSSESTPSSDASSSSENTSQQSEPTSVPSSSETEPSVSTATETTTSSTTTTTTTSTTTTTATTTVTTTATTTTVNSEAAAE